MFLFEQSICTSVVTLLIQSQMRLSFGMLKNSYQTESDPVNFGVHQPFGIRIRYRF